MTQKQIDHRKTAQKLRIESANRLLQSIDWQATLYSLEEEANAFNQQGDWASYTFLATGIISGLIKKEKLIKAETWCKKLETALVHLEEKYICRVYLHECRAILSGLKGNLENTLEEYQRAVSILQQLKPSNPSYLVKLMGEVGNLFIWKEDYYKAEVTLQQALNLQYSNNNADPVETAIIYLYLSVSQVSLKDFDASFDCLTKSLNLLLKHLPEDDPDILYAYAHFSNYHLVKAQSHNLPKDYQQIIHYCELILKSKSSSKERYATDSYQNLGFAHTELGNWKQAESYLHKSLNAIRSYYGFEHPQLSDSYKSLGICYRKQEKWKAAKQQFQLALNTLYPHQTIGQHYSLCPPITGYINAKVLLEILLEKGKTCYHAVSQQKYKTTQSQLQDLQISIETFDITCQLLDKMRIGFDLAESKLLLTQKSERGQLFEFGVKASLKAQELQLEVNGKQGKHWAFDFCEKAKANILIQAIQDTVAKASSNLPQDLLQQESELKNTLTRLDKNIQNLTSNKKQKSLNLQESQQLQHWQTRFYTEYEKYSQLKKQLEEKYPDYFQVKYNTKIVGVDALQQLLEQNQVLLNYFVASDFLFLFICTSDDFEVIRHPKPNDFEETIEQFLQAIKHHNQTTYTEKATELYQLLLQSAEDYFIDWTGMEEELKHLIIIPDKILAYIPFEALLRTTPNTHIFSVRNLTSFEATPNTLNSSNVSYQELDYLLKHTLVSYHYSATLFAYQQQKDKQEKEGNILNNHNFAGFAPVYSSNDSANPPIPPMASQSVKQAETVGMAWATRSEAIRSNGNLVPLPYSKLEVEKTAQLFEQKGFKTKTYLYEKATKEQFEADAKRFRFLLVAAHGVVNDEKTALSGLVFYPTTDDKRWMRNKTIVEKSSLFEKHGDIWNRKPITDHHSTLSMEETYHLDLSQTDLVVLSSCDSGIGRLVKGEGMMAVNRGFLYAGAKNVISTLFKVYDKPSSLLTQYLFEGILEGKSYPLALQSAKLRLMQQEGVTVKSWSGFVLIGY